MFFVEFGNGIIILIFIFGYINEILVVVLVMMYKCYEYEIE